MARGEMAAATIPCARRCTWSRISSKPVRAWGSRSTPLGDGRGRPTSCAVSCVSSPEAQARQTLATALMAKQDWPAAQRELHEIVRREPHNVQAHYSLGIVCYARGDLDGAIDAYQQVLARSPISTTRATTRPSC